MCNIVDTSKQATYVGIRHVQMKHAILCSEYILNLAYLFYC